MTIYKVLDENNRYLKHYQQHDLAVRCSEVLTELFPNHQYHIEEAMLDETKVTEQTEA